MGFPGGPVVKILPCNTGDLGLIPGQGTKIPHASEQLTLHATSIEPTTRESVHGRVRGWVGEEGIPAQNVRGGQG